MIRYFRSNVSVYSDLSRQLDEAYGYPKPELKTERVLPLASELPTDSDGRVYLSIAADYCDYAIPAQVLPQLLASGAVEEIDADAYRAAVMLHQ